MTVKASCRDKILLFYFSMSLYLLLKGQTTPRTTTGRKNKALDVIIARAADNHGNLSQDLLGETKLSRVKKNQKLKKTIFFF